MVCGWAPAHARYVDDHIASWDAPSSKDGDLKVRLGVAHALARRERLRRRHLCRRPCIRNVHVHPRAHCGRSACRRAPRRYQSAREGHDGRMSTVTRAARKEEELKGRIAGTRRAELDEALVFDERAHTNLLVGLVHHAHVRRVGTDADECRRSREGEHLQGKPIDGIYSCNYVLVSEAPDITNCHACPDSDGVAPPQNCATELVLKEEAQVCGVRSSPRLSPF